MAEERETTWWYDVSNTTTDRKGRRPSVMMPGSYEMTGIGAETEGGLSPFYGFKHVYTFASRQQSGGDMGWPGSHSNLSTVHEVFPVNFKIGSNSYGYGFVYRLQRTSGGVCDLFIDYWNSDTGLWKQSTILNDSGDPVALPREIDPETGKQMSVSVWGRFVYVFVEGREPVRFSVAEDLLGTETIAFDTGPGLRPTLLSHEDNVGLGGVVATGDADRPGAGQIFLTEFLPSEVVGLGLGSGTGSDGKQDNDNVALFTSGDYAFAYVLYNSENGLRSALSEIAQVTHADFDPDGSGAALVTNLRCAIEITYDTAKYDQAYVYRSVRVQSAGGTYIAAILHLEAIIDLENFHTSNNPLAGTLRQAVYFYELEDKQLVRQDTFVDNVLFDENMPQAGCSLLYENTMLCSNVEGSAVSTTVENRPDDGVRGLGELRWSSLTDISLELFSPQNRYYPNLPNNRIIAMKQVGPNVVGFSRDRQYIIRKEGSMSVHEVHDGYGVVSPHAAETIGSMVYYVTPKGLKSTDVQAALDDIRSLNQIFVEEWASSITRVSIAYDPHTSSLFILNPSTEETYILWFNTARVTRVIDTNFAFCARGCWPLNFGTLDETDLLDDHGVSQLSEYSKPLTERVFFVRNHPTPATVGDIDTSFKIRLYVVDSSRERVQENGAYDGEPRRTLFPFTGDSIFTLTSDFTSGQDIAVETGGSIFLGTDIGGCKLYVLESPNHPELVGLSATIQKSVAGTSIRVSSTEDSTLYGLEEGDVVGISPVVVRWVGYPLPLLDESGEVAPAQNFFRIRHASTVGLSITDVTNERSAETTGSITGLVYRGSDADPYGTGATLNTSGDPVNGLMNYEGVYHIGITGSASDSGKYGVSGSCLSPGFQIIVPDVTFNVIGVAVGGAIRAANRSRRPS